MVTPVNSRGMTFQNCSQETAPTSDAERKPKSMLLHELFPCLVSKCVSLTGVRTKFSAKETMESLLWVLRTPSHRLIFAEHLAF